MRRFSRSPKLSRRRSTSFSSQQQQQRRFSLESDNTETNRPLNCNVIQGPALLHTALYRPNPSLIFLPGLRSIPFWSDYNEQLGENRVAYQDPTVTQIVRHLERDCTSIRDEYDSVATKFPSDYSIDHNEHSLHEGSWDWHSYMLKGRRQPSFVSHFPNTARILEELRQEELLFEGTPFGYAFFSTLHARSSIAAHTSPMNFRLRVHLPLHVPHSTGIRVGPRTNQWHEGQALVIDDAFEHEVWNQHPQESRVLLLVDIWHPDVTIQERQDIVRMFQHAKQQGWWKNA